MTDDMEDIETPSEKRTKVASVRLTPSEWEEIRARAERAGMVVNSYIVWAACRAPERADIRDMEAPLALSDGTVFAVVGSGADVQDAAAAVVIDDDGDALLAMAAAEAGRMNEPSALLADVVWKEGDLARTFDPCGHPNIPDNRTKRGPGRPDACRICRNAATRASRKRVKERANAKVAGADRGAARNG